MSMRQDEMAITTQLEIVSAEGSIFSGLVESVIANGEYGELGIIPGHAPLLTVLKPGEVQFTRQGGEKESYYVSGGMLEVQPYVVTVLADHAIRADHLDEQAAIASQKHAEAAIASHDADMEYSVAAVEMARAAAQIRIIQKLKRRRGS
jgi:F-type H+-transporting ATPase subunit epsilon